MPTIICSYCEYVGSGKYYKDQIADVDKHEETCSEKPKKNCCPHCKAPIDKIYECHPFSSDAGAYFVCDVCGARFEPYEYEELKT